MLTLAAPATASLEVRHSRFRAQASPVASSADALAFVQRCSDPEATHNCWAYRTGAEYRSSDDGEPAGTAGRPILAAIDGARLDGVAVVVTRWYGGINLGAGGLVRAYGGCAARCLRDAATVQRVEWIRVAVQFAFGDTGAVHAAIAASGAERLGETFDGGGAAMHLRVPRDRLTALKVQLRDATRDRIRLQEPSDA